MEGRERRTLDRELVWKDKPNFTRVQMPITTAEALYNYIRVVKHVPTKEYVSDPLAYRISKPTNRGAKDAQEPRQSQDP